MSRNFPNSPDAEENSPDQLEVDLGKNYNIEFIPVEEEDVYATMRPPIEIALYGHQELPQNSQFIYPQLSPDGMHVSLIGRDRFAQTDTVFIWETVDAYQCKFMYENIKVDNVVFCPDNKSFIIIYKDSAPVMYSLLDGSKIKEFEDNQEKDKKGVQYAFTNAKQAKEKGKNKDRHSEHFGKFAYCTEKSFTVWLMEYGSIYAYNNKKENTKDKIYIADDSPYKLLVGLGLVCVDRNMTVRIYKDWRTKKVDKSFSIKGVKFGSILDCKVDRELKFMLLALEDKVAQYFLDDKVGKDFCAYSLKNVKKAVISHDLKCIAYTDLSQICVYDFGKKTMVYGHQFQRFENFNIDFDTKIIVLIDPISIIIHKFHNQYKVTDEYIWLNKNPTEFLNYHVTEDYSHIFAVLDEKNAVLYDLEKGKIVKKWHCDEDDWSVSCVLMPEESGKHFAITKSEKHDLIFYDLISMQDDFRITGLDTYSVSFTKDGKFMAVGAREGEEIARLYDIPKYKDTRKHKSFHYSGSKGNKYTVVHLTESGKLICACIGQNPVVFDTDSTLFQYECELTTNLDKIFEIESGTENNVFVVRARKAKKEKEEADIESQISKLEASEKKDNALLDALRKKKKDLELKRRCAYLIDLDTGKLIQSFSECWNIKLVDAKGLLFAKCSNLHDNNVMIYKIQDLKCGRTEKATPCNLETDTAGLLSDGQAIVSGFGNKREVTYLINSLDDGRLRCEVDFNSLSDNHFEIELTADKESHELIFKYMEFCSNDEYIKVNRLNFPKKIGGVVNSMKNWINGKLCGVKYAE